MPAPPLQGKQVKVWTAANEMEGEVVKSLAVLNITDHGDLLLYSLDGCVERGFSAGSWDRFVVERDPDGVRPQLLVPTPVVPMP
jgi:hypothetical protein